MYVIIKNTIFKIKNMNKSAYFFVRALDNINVENNFKSKTKYIFYNSELFYVKLKKL